MIQILLQVTTVFIIMVSIGSAIVYTTNKVRNFIDKRK